MIPTRRAAMRSLAEAPALAMLASLKTWHLVPVLAVLLCPYLLCDSSTELKKAQDLLARGSLAEAVTVLRQVVHADRDNFDGHLLLGTALALQGLRAESLKEIEASINLSPNSPKARNEQGVILSRFLETDAARKAFENALSLDPDFAEAHVNLAVILAQTGELPLAHEHLDKAIDLYGSGPSGARACFLRAKVWTAQGDNDNAILDLEKATRLNAKYADAWFDLSQLKHSKGYLDSALSAAEKAVDLSSKDAQAQSWLGQLYLERGNAVEAVKHLQTAHSLGADDKTTLYSLARALRATGKIQDARLLEQKVIEMQRLRTRSNEAAFTASGLNEEGLRLEHEGDLLGALEKYRAAVDLDPIGYGFRLNYALALCRLGRWREGVTQLQEVLKEDPDNADAAKALFIAQDQLAKKSK